MRINRALLYAGAFLVAIGGVLVVVDQGVLASSTVGEALRYWPLAVLAIGAGLVFRHTQVSLASGLLAAAVPGLLLGGTFAVAPRISGDCGIHGQPQAVTTRDGAFSGAADISVDVGCGTLTMGTAPGSGWHLDATNSGNRAVAVDASASSLSVASTGAHGWPDVIQGGRNAWTLTLPTSEISSLGVTVNAGTGQISLPGAAIGRLDLVTNAAELSVDASGASVHQLSATVNLGVLSIRVPSNGDMTGSFEVNAAGIKVCAPEGIGLRVDTRDIATQVTVGGLKQAGSTWQSANYLSAEHHADLDITGSFGAVDINPIGGCK